MHQTITVEHQGAVLRVRLNRPEVRNAFNGRMIEELTDTFAQLAGRDDIRVVVLSGNGKLFSAGADINWMRASLEYSRQENLDDARRISDMFAAIDTVSHPVIGRVHGAALGGGMGLIAVCDIVVAAEDAVFGFTETKLGIIPAVISRFVVPRIGESWARALFLSGERFGTSIAQRIGLVHWTVPDSDLDNEVDARVRELLSAGPEAVREAKALIRAVTRLEHADVRDFTAERIAALRTAPEGQEGLRAFIDKRKPAWSSSVE